MEMTKSVTIELLNCSFLRKAKINGMSVVLKKI
jgi:hypothetical protein